jgi:hypothetical protein
MGYEVALPVAVFGLSLVWWRARSWFADRLMPRAGLRGATLLLPEFLVIVASVVYKAMTAVQTEIPGSYFSYLLRIAAGAVTTNLVAWGIDLPRATWWALGVSGMRGLLVGAAVALATFVYVRRLALLESPERGAWLPFVGAGAAVFVLGYVIFATNARILFTATGIGNRVAIAASTGIAVAGVGVIGLLSSRGRGPFRATVFSLVVALWVGAGTCAVLALAQQWASAWAREQNVLEDLQQDLPTLPANSTVILAKVCPYEGSATVFESNWDLAGALEVLYNDPTVRADVAGGGLRIRANAVESVLYGTHKARYPYGSRLLIYDHGSREISRAVDAGAARDALGEVLACPGRPGEGETILPADDLQRRIESWLE